MENKKRIAFLNSSELEIFVALLDLVPIECYKSGKTLQEELNKFLGTKMNYKYILTKLNMLVIAGILDSKTSYNGGYIKKQLDITYLDLCKKLNIETFCIIPKINEEIKNILNQSIK